MKEDLKFPRCYKPEEKEINEMQFLKMGGEPVDISFKIDVDGLDYYSFKKVCEPYSRITIRLENNNSAIRIFIKKQLLDAPEFYNSKAEADDDDLPF